MIRGIIQAPDPRLRQMSAPVAEGWGELPKSVRDLRETFLGLQNCVGLAAPQIGYAERVIVFDVTPTRVDTVVMINPVILRASESLQLVKDGCMSVSYGWKFGATRRPKRLIVSFLDEQGVPRKRKLSGFAAAVVHHEIDHLDGKLFTDMLPPSEREGIGEVARDRAASAVADVRQQDQVPEEDRRTDRGELPTS